ncbi:MAG: SDR family oxidoreductase [Elusimicrobia bacterium]|nr:SDR family oxidoreductase [Elusimicrobiota bacterium]
MSTKVLITGGAGYIGSVLTPLLLKNSYQVTVLDSFIFRQNGLLDCCENSNFEVIRGDCRDERVLKDLIKNKDFIIPLAAMVGAPLCDIDRETANSVNLDAIKKLCSMLSKSQRILYPTTNSGYGIGEKDKFCTEETPLRPISFYGITKSQAEKTILERGNSITFRLATAFGSSPRMRMDLLVNDFVYRAVTDHALVIFEGHFKRNYIHVRDISKAFLHGMTNFEKMKDQPYNVGLEDANLSKIELCQIIQKMLLQFVFVESPIGEDPDKRDYIVSNKKILSTGYKPDFTIEHGVQELIKCYTIVRKNQYANY